MHGGSVEWLRLRVRDLDWEEGGGRGGRGCRLGMAEKKRERFIEANGFWESVSELESGGGRVGKPTRCSTRSEDRK